MEETVLAQTRGTSHDVNSEQKCEKDYSWSESDRTCFPLTREMIRRRDHNRTALQDRYSEGCAFIRKRNSSIPHYACKQVGMLDEEIAKFVELRDTSRKVLSKMSKCVYYRSSQPVSIVDKSSSSRDTAEFVKHSLLENVLDTTIRSLRQNQQNVISFLVELDEYTGNSVHVVDALIYNNYDSDKVYHHIDMIYTITFALFGYTTEINPVHVPEIDDMVQYVLKAYIKPSSNRQLPTWQDIIEYMLSYKNCRTFYTRLKKLFDRLGDYIE